MRLKTVQVIAGLLAIVAFLLAFMATGIFLLSTAFMLLGLIAVGWLTWSLIRKARETPGDRAV